MQCNYVLLCGCAEDNKDEEAKDEVPPAAAEEGGEPKPAEGEAPPKQEDGETGAKVTVEVQLETG